MHNILKLHLELLHATAHWLPFELCAVPWIEQQLDLDLSCTLLLDPIFVPHLWCFTAHVDAVCSLQNVIRGMLYAMILLSLHDIPP